MTRSLKEIRQSLSKVDQDLSLVLEEYRDLLMVVRGPDNEEKIAQEMGRLEDIQERMSSLLSAQAELDDEANSAIVAGLVDRATGSGGAEKNEIDEGATTS